jgi:anthranilate synthase component 2
MKILVLDNYDSFVYNLVHLLRELGHSPEVFRNNKLPLEAVAAYDKILLSPGPGIPSEAGLMPQIIQAYAAQKSILGVCLGHQAIGEAFGAQLHNLPEVLHGISSTMHITDTSEPLFAGLPEQLSIGHYHSWVVEAGSLPESLRITATDERGHVMALAHTRYDVRGVQFHPESVMTAHGREMLANWLGI